MNLKEARAIAAAYIREGELRREGFAAVIVDAATRETDFCWVFVYDSEAHVRSGDFADAIAGNGPIIIYKSNGTIVSAGTARPIDDVLNELRAKL